MTNPGGTIATEAGHWYTQTGEPCYEVPNKSKPGEMRPTNKGDARKLNLSPGFSGISSILAAPALERWKRTQQLLCSAELKRDPLEGDQEWMDRVTDLYIERTTSARDLGTVIHGCIETALDARPIPPEYQIYNQHTIAAIKAVDDWCGIDRLSIEKSFAHPLGYGGKVDIHKPGFVGDFKTKEFTEADLPSVYDNHFMQLAAYREGLGMSSARCAIIYVSTSVPGLTHLIEVSQDSLDRGWDIFERLVDLWQIVNNYKPKTEITTQEEEMFV
jgi:hypothetical protein